MHWVAGKAKDDILYIGYSRDQKGLGLTRTDNLSRPSDSINYVLVKSGGLKFQRCFDNSVYYL